jgi:hypothetical protein
MPPVVRWPARPGAPFERNSGPDLADRASRAHTFWRSVYVDLP